MRKESSHMLIFMFHRILIKCVKSDFIIKYLYLGPVVQKPINANPGLKINQGVYFSIPKCC